MGIIVKRIYLTLFVLFFAQSSLNCAAEAAGGRRRAADGSGNSVSEEVYAGTEHLEGIRVDTKKEVLTAETADALRKTEFYQNSFQIADEEANFIRSECAKISIVLEHLGTIFDAAVYNHFKTWITSLTYSLFMFKRHFGQLTALCLAYTEESVAEQLVEYDAMIMDRDAVEGDLKALAQMIDQRAKDNGVTLSS